MPPRTRRTIVYNLSGASSGARAAFEQGLDFHSDDEDSAGMLGSSPPGSSSRYRSSTQQSAFSDLDPRRHRHHPQDGGDLLYGRGSERDTVELVHLLELFPGADRSLVEEVFAGCGYSFDRALDMLSELLAGNSHAPDSTHGDHTSHGDVNHAAGASAAGGTGPDAHGSGPVWNDLPAEVKDMVLGMLPINDVARAAATCKEFAHRVKMGAVNAKALTIPLGLSLSSIISMVACHPNAHTVSLTRWAAQGLQERDFAALLSAISNGSRSSRRNTPVESLSLRGWSGLKDGHVMTICSTLQHLKELDLTGCSGITDAALLVLSKYQRSPPSEPDSPTSEPEQQHGFGAGGVQGTGVRAGGSSSDDEPGPSVPVPVGRGGLSKPGNVVKAGQQPGREGEGDDDELFFEMDASEATPASAALKTRRRAADNAPAGDEEQEDEEDEEGPGGQRRLEALAALASSPPMTWGLLGEQGVSPGTSPPSRLMVPESALGAQMARLGWGEAARAAGEGGRLSNRATGSGGGAAPGAGQGRGPAGASGWVGSWERRGLTLPKGQKPSTPQPQQLQQPQQGGVPASASPSSVPRQPSSSLLAQFQLGGSSPPSSSPAPGSSPPAASGGFAGFGRPTPRIQSATGLGFRSLVFAGCSQISAEGVKTLLSAPLVKASLEALDISRCQKMNRQALNVPPASCLRVLKCSSCNNLLEVLIQLPPTCPLTELHLNNCKQLSRITLVAPNLRLLHIGGCKNMVNVSLRCPLLTQLLANLCFSWASISADQWVCPRLQHLNLFGARHLETPSLAVMLDLCRELRHLNLNGCNTVTELHITDDHASLATLDVSGCKGLVSVRVSSLALLEVQAKSCPRLQEVCLDSRNLRRLDVSHCMQLQRLHLQALSPLQQALLNSQAQMQAGAGVGALVGVGAATGAAAEAVPELCTLYAERLLPPATVTLIRAAKAARRAAKAEAWAAAAAQGAA